MATLALTAVAMPPAASAQNSFTTALHGNNAAVLSSVVGGAALHKCTVIAAPPGRESSLPSVSHDAGYALAQQMPPTTTYIDVTC